MWRRKAQWAYFVAACAALVIAGWIGGFYAFLAVAALAFAVSALLTRRARRKR
jgi:hypothetical protein